MDTDNDITWLVIAAGPQSYGFGTWLFTLKDRYTRCHVLYHNKETVYDKVEYCIGYWKERDLTRIVPRCLVVGDVGEAHACKEAVDALWPEARCALFDRQREDALDLRGWAFGYVERYLKWTDNYLHLDHPHCVVCMRRIPFGFVYNARLMGCDRCMTCIQCMSACGFCHQEKVCLCCPPDDDTCTRCSRGPP